MQHKTLIINLLALCLSTQAIAQSTLDSVLASVERNNKSLAADRQHWKAKTLEYQTGLTLPNPTVQGQYLLGSPATAGNQTDFFAVQPFEVPSVYKQRRALAQMQATVGGSETEALRQDVLLEANLVCLEIVYRNKLAAQYERRRSELEKLLADFQKKLTAGDGNILDVNKTRLQVLENNQLQLENNNHLKKLQTHLLELNGGRWIVFQDTVYPTIVPIVSFDVHEAASEAADPHRMTLEQQKRVAEKQLALSRSWRLPTLELGYHYQGILGQRFNGIHAGASIPIWEQKYRKAAQQAQVISADLALKNHLNEHYHFLKEKYEVYTALRVTHHEYGAALASVSNTALLDKALRLGQISTIEYFMEMSFYQNALLHYLKTEYDYHVVVAELMQYKL